MTVAELIQSLGQHPAGARVVMPGYEGGLVDVSATESVPIRLNVHTEWYYGPHDDASDYNGDPDEMAILIA